MPNSKLQSLVSASERIVFFGGAGVSTESGIPDYRSPDGLYHQNYPYPPEIMLSHSFFLSHTEEFYRFYRDKMVHTEAKPNAAHLTLAQLERAGKLKSVVTQNVDGLHQAAGSQNVLELHGSIHRNYCMDCQAPYSLSAVLEAEGVPTCSCGGVIRPDVVLYEETLDDRIMGQATDDISKADLLIVGGASLSVYPAAGLLRYFRGGSLALINKSPTPMDDRADLLIRESIGAVFASLEV